MEGGQDEGGGTGVETGQQRVVHPAQLADPGRRRAGTKLPAVAPGRDHVDPAPGQGLGQGTEGGEVLARGSPGDREDIGPLEAKRTTGRLHGRPGRKTAVDSPGDDGDLPRVGAGKLDNLVP